MAGIICDDPLSALDFLELLSSIPDSGFENFADDHLKPDSQYTNYCGLPNHVEASIGTILPIRLSFVVRSENRT